MVNISPSYSACKSTFEQGGVIAYPTEAVFGLGCDPSNQRAVNEILRLKHRPAEKGVILIASSFEQLLPYIDISSISDIALTDIKQSWPGHVTWLLPKHSSVPAWLSGDSDKIAVRVTAHEPARQLCQACCSALVSTSANPAGEEPARTSEQVVKYFSNAVLLAPGNVGEYANPSEIRDGLSGKTIRG